MFLPCVPLLSIFFLSLPHSPPRPFFRACKSCPSLSNTRASAHFLAKTGPLCFCLYFDRFLSLCPLLHLIGSRRGSVETGLSEREKNTKSPATLLDFFSISQTRKRRKKNGRGELSDARADRQRSRTGKQRRNPSARQQEHPHADGQEAGEQGTFFCLFFLLSTTNDEKKTKKSKNVCCQSKRKKIEPSCFLL